MLHSVENSFYTEIVTVKIYMIFSIFKGKNFNNHLLKLNLSNFLNSI